MKYNSSKWYASKKQIDPTTCQEASLKWTNETEVDILTLRKYKSMKENNHVKVTEQHQ